MDTAQTFQLPPTVVSPTDIARLVRELENLDEFFRQLSIRQDGPGSAIPRYSRLLDEVVVANATNLLDQSNRDSLLGQLRGLENRVPVMHISFSVDPPGQYVQKIVTWLRNNIDPLVLVRVGLQPTIGAGCILRTPNKAFDFSLRQFFDQKHGFFMEKLHEAVQPVVGEQLTETPPLPAPVVAAPEGTTVPVVPSPVSDALVGQTAPSPEVAETSNSAAPQVEQPPQQDTDAATPIAVRVVTATPTPAPEQPEVVSSVVESIAVVDAPSAVVPEEVPQAPVLTLSATPIQVQDESAA